MLERALEARRELPGWDDPCAALRLFNGFYEGCPDLVIDRYAATLLIFNYADDPQQIAAWLPELQQLMLASLPGVTAVLVKTRRAEDPLERRGRLTWGEQPDAWIEENGVRYALDLTMNQDASFYLDTRGLRAWIRSHAAGKRVLNTFAYTGSLGVAALAGGAQRVVQLDLSRRFLGLARQSAQLNHLPAERHSLRPGNFFTLSSQMRRDREEYDLVILDPPFFASSGQGRVDLNDPGLRLVNKVRPLAADGGYLVVVNNALFVSGAQFQAGLDGLCQGGYLRLVERVDVPADVTGPAETVCSRPPADPAPFNHPTKIAILQVKKKATTDGHRY